VRRAALVILIVALLVAAALVARLSRRPAAEPPPTGIGAVLRRGDRVVLTNAQGRWTVFTRCVPGVVGPGYIARLEAGDGRVLVDDEIGPGTLNDTDFGGLGAFGWHHARGLPGELRFDADNAWEVSGRTCASANGGFGVVASRVVELGDDSLTVEVDLGDGFTYPEPLMRVRYRYAVEPDAVSSWITVTELCGDGSCGRTDELAFVKEPKLVAHTGNAFARLDVLDPAVGTVCSARPGGPARGPILRTTQCSDPRRAVVRFEPCAPTCLEVEAGGWEGEADGFDAWAVSAATRPAAFPVDTPSIDGVLWPCHGGDPSGAKMRRWELAGRAGGSVGVLFPAWEGGRGGYDCEPLARTFGPRGETWRARLTYSLVRGSVRG
jgi:hypothetical protein